MEDDGFTLVRKGKGLCSRAPPVAKSARSQGFGYKKNARRPPPQRQPPSQEEIIADIELK
ncbi:hypothetical protein HK097_003271, partial [Rhizophlyctis rosea]